MKFVVVDCDLKKLRYSPSAVVIPWILCHVRSARMKNRLKKNQYYLDTSPEFLLFPSYEY